MLRGLGRVFSNQISKKLWREKGGEFFDFGRKFRHFSLAFELCDAGYADVGGVRDLDGHRSGRSRGYRDIVFDKEKMSVQKAFYLSLITLSAVMLKII